MSRNNLTKRLALIASESNCYPVKIFSHCYSTFFYSWFVLKKVHYTATHKICKDFHSPIPKSIIWILLIRRDEKIYWNYIFLSFVQLVNHNDRVIHSVIAEELLFRTLFGWYGYIVVMKLHTDSSIELYYRILIPESYRWALESFVIVKRLPLHLVGSAN